MTKIILPKTYIEYNKQIDNPLIFLAGPIRHAPDWQEEAIKYLFSKNKNIIIANPRWNASKYISSLAIDGRTDFFTRQRAWEKHYLNIAFQNGCVLFWLENAPGLMTRVELGQSMAHYQHDKNTKFCVGGDKKFLDIETIRYDLLTDTGKNIFSTLEETCNNALEMTEKPHL